MTRTSLFARLRGAAEILDSARSVAAAVDAGRRPSARHLARLGISEAAFESIRIR